MNKTMKGWPLAAVACAVCVSTPALADFDYVVRAGGNYSDNVERRAVDEQGSGAAVVGLELRGVRDTGRLQYNVNGDVSYQDYFKSGVSSETFGRLLGASSYEIVSDFFKWNLAGSFNRVRADLLLPAAPGNLESATTVSTGPTFTAHFGEAFVAQLDGNYSMSNYSASTLDSETIGGQLILGRQMSERSLIGLGGSYEDVSYDSNAGGAAPDFKRREAFIRFNTEGSRTSLTADAGYAKVSGGSVDDDGLMARVIVSRRMTPYLSAFVGFQREYPTSDAAAFTGDVSTGGDTATDSSVLTGAPRRSDNADLGLRYTRPRTAAEVAYTHRRETALSDTSIKRDYDQVRASFTRALPGRSTASVYGTYSLEDISGVSDQTKEAIVGTQVDFMFGRALGLEVRLEYRDRNSNIALTDYSEFMGGIFLRYGSTRALEPYGADAR